MTAVLDFTWHAHRRHTAGCPPRTGGAGSLGCEIVIFPGIRMERRAPGEAPEPASDDAAAAAADGAEPMLD